MKRRKITGRSFFLGCTACMLLLSGCSGQNGAKTEAEGTKNGEHEAITMEAPFRKMGDFIDIVHEKYPEINLEVIPYSGENYTAYVRAEMEAGDMPDIYFTSYYTPGYDVVSDKLVNLAGYDFTDNYAPARIRDVTEEDGSVYMLPTYYDCFGITYNKTLLKKNGWELPGSFKELEELALKVKSAGYDLCLDEIKFPGYGFQYLCNILDTCYLNSPEGREWQTAFLKGETKVAQSPELLEQLKTLEKWRDIGMFNGKGRTDSDDDTKMMMAEGNTLFLLGSTNIFTQDESTDEFGLMPYLSEDGTRNVFILNVNRFVGLNKHLEETGNEQKLEDALHVLEVLSTVEGMEALNSAHSNTSLLPLKDYKISTNGYYAELEEQLNSGATAPLIYNGWNAVIVPVGEAMISFIKGEAELEDIIHAFDDNQYLLQDNTDSQYTTVTEKIDTEHCAKLVGICFSKAVDADMALISKNKWYPLDDEEDLNLEGVSGCLFPLPVTDEEIVSILPTGWRLNIQTVSLTGAQVKELAENGYDRNHDPQHTFPYELVTPENFKIQDDTLYKVVIAGVTSKVAEEGNLEDTGVLGLDAAREYFGQFETFSEKDIVWE